MQKITNMINKPNKKALGSENNRKAQVIITNPNSPFIKKLIDIEKNYHTMKIKANKAERREQCYSKSEGSNQVVTNNPKPMINPTSPNKKDIRAQNANNAMKFLNLPIFNRNFFAQYFLTSDKTSRPQLLMIFLPTILSRDWQLMPKSLSR